MFYDVLKKILNFLWSALSSIYFILFFVIFLFEFPLIPTASMKDNFNEGDFVVAQKYAYGYSSLSLTHASMFKRFLFKTSNPRIFNYHYTIAKPQYGDIIQFAFIPEELSSMTVYNQNIQAVYIPFEESSFFKYYCKRVIGRPHDKIKIANNVIYLNGKSLLRRYDGIQTISNPDGTSFEAEVVFETNHGNTYKTIFQKNNEVHYMPEITLKDNEYFVLGDNRLNSYDSRFFGPIQENHITAKVIYKIGSVALPTFIYKILNVFPSWIKYLLMHPITWVFIVYMIYYFYRKNKKS